MGLTIIECEQNSPEWLRARMGRPTASKFSDVLSTPSGRTEIPVRTRYLYQLATEIITGEPMVTYSNKDMEGGHVAEPLARQMFEFLADKEIKQVGFVTNDSLVKGRILGCSPDGLIGSDETFECKATGPHLLIHRILGNDSISEHTAQVQGGMWVCERSMCNLVTFHAQNMPMIKRRIKRDDNYINKLALALRVFCDELDEVVEKVRRYGQ